MTEWRSPSNSSLWLRASYLGNKDWIDPVIGLAARYKVDDKWSIDAQADIGGLSNSATGQALGSVGYNWTKNISTMVGYRVMYAYDKDENARGGTFRLQGVDLRAVRRFEVQLLMAAL